MLTSHEIRKRFLDFFASERHVVLDSASLVTEDASGDTNATLFNTAGMQPLIPYLLGKEHPEGRRLTSSQKCVRTTDLEDVGDATHATFFEMLGNWSLGDYFKQDAIRWSWEFLTNKDKGLGLDSSRLYVTVFAGNDSVERDDEAANIWKQYVPEHRIYYLDSRSNWWKAGDNSPAGPSTEMFYDVTGELGDMSHEEFLRADKEQKVVEIWNDVFMVYKLKGGEVEGMLPQKNVDTGAGLERVTAVVQGATSIYETDIYEHLLARISAATPHLDALRPKRIVADHIRTAVFLVGDGIKPSNTDRGYVLRRIIRRMVNNMNILEMNCDITELIDIVIEKYGQVYLNLDKKKDIIIAVISQEVLKYKKTLERGKKEFQKLAQKNNTRITGQELAILEQTHGFPAELSLDLAEEFGVRIEPHAFDEYKKLTEQHQKKSRAGSEQKFKGGLAGNSEMEIRYHTATHLLHQALRDVLGNHVMQKGSNITLERMRFDFSHNNKMTDEEIHRVEFIVNEKIQEGLSISFQTVSLEEAQNSGALGLFEDRYEDRVDLYQIGSGDGMYSLEICGGPHVSNTKELGVFKIIKEEALGSGVRRIKAVLS
jgi:alanyl-tRNA synthetase